MGRELQAQHYIALDTYLVIDGKRSYRSSPGGTSGFWQVSDLRKMVTAGDFIAFAKPEAMSLLSHRDGRDKALLSHKGLLHHLAGYTGQDRELGDFRHTR